MIKYLLAFLLAACTPADAQWQTPNGSVPIGRGAGKTGFSNAAPGTAGLPLVSNGPGVDPSFKVMAPPSGFVPALLTATTFFLNGDTVSSQPCGAFTCSPGNDANDCLAIATPCRTIQHTLAFVAANYNFAGQTVIVQASKGTYNECVILPPYLSSNPTDKLVFLQGNTTVSDVVVTCGSGSAFTAVNSPQGWVLKNITVNATNACAYADYNGKIFWDGGNFAACTNFDVQAVNNGAFFEFVNNPYSVSANTQCHVSVVNGGEIIWNGVTADMIGTPNFSAAFMCSDKNNGTIDDAALTISGAFVGSKYQLQGPSAVFSTGTTASTSASTQYIGQSSISNAENNYFVTPMSAAGFVDLYVNATAAPGVGQTFIFTVRVGGSPSTLTCTMSGAAATKCSDKLHLGVSGSGLISAGDVLDLQMVSSAGAATAIISAGMVSHN